MNEYLIICGVFCLFFYRALLCGYVVDDVSWHAKLQPYKKDKFKGWKVHRIIQTVLYGAGIFKDGFQEHLFTSSLHLINSLLIYKVTGSLLAALLYMVNPVNNQTALWLNGRRYSICVLCCLLAWSFKAFMIPLFAFSAFIHVSGIMLPIVFLFTDYWYMTPIALILGGIVGGDRMINKYKSRKKTFSEDNELQKLTFKKIVIVIKSLGFYFTHIICPQKPTMYHEFLYYFGRYQKEIDRGYRLNFDFWKGLAICSFLMYEIIAHQNIWAIWFLAFQIQYSNILTVTMTVADRYTCISSIGVMMIMVKYVDMIPDPYRVMVYAVIFTYYFAKYQPLFRAYGNIEEFYLYQINLQPEGVDARCLLAELYINRRRLYSAFSVIQQGLLYRKGEFKLTLTMVNVLLNLNRYDEALRIMEIAIKHAPKGEAGEATDAYNDLVKQVAGAKLQERMSIMSRKQKRSMR